MNRAQRRKIEKQPETVKVRFLYTPQTDIVNIQIASWVLLQLPFAVFESGYNEMKTKRESKIITPA